jgi:aminoglycoside 6'-N-acetyltransferase I
MNIRPVQPSDAGEWLRMRMALWPDSTLEKEASEIMYFLAVPPRPVLPTLHAVFVCPRLHTGLCGLVEVSIRPYADGCQTTDVGYLEAWYVDPDSRGQGIGRALVMAAEAWARRHGCREMASDADLTNSVSQAAHQQLGYIETGRSVQYCKVLAALPAAVRPATES